MKPAFHSCSPAKPSRRNGPPTSSCSAWGSPSAIRPNRGFTSLPAGAPVALGVIGVLAIVALIATFWLSTVRERKLSEAKRVWPELEQMQTPDLSSTNRKMAMLQSYVSKYRGTGWRVDDANRQYDTLKVAKIEHEDRQCQTERDELLREQRRQQAEAEAQERERKRLEAERQFEELRRQNQERLAREREERRRAAPGKRREAVALTLGTGDSVDHQKALQLLSSAVDDGDPVSTAILHGFLYTGTVAGLPRDTATAQSLEVAVAQELESLAAQGDIDAMYAAAVVNLFDLAGKGDKELGRRFLDEAASGGHLMAMNHLGSIILQAPDNDKDTSRALAMLQSAADAGNKEALITMAAFLGNTTGPKRDEARAFEYCQAAARAKHPRAVGLLGSFYLHGSCVAKNHAMAFALLSEGDRMGDNTSQLLLGDYYLKHAVIKDPHRAFPFYLRAAHNGNTEAAYMVGTCMLKGDGTPPQPENAQPYLLQAARDGHVDAMGALGTLLAQTSPHPLKRKEGMHWLTQSASRGNTSAMLVLSRLLRTDAFGTADTESATKWLQEAAKAGDQSARTEATQLGIKW